MSDTTEDIKPVFQNKIRELEERLREADTVIYQLQTEKEYIVNNVYAMPKPYSCSSYNAGTLKQRDSMQRDVNMFFDTIFPEMNMKERRKTCRICMESDVVSKLVKEGCKLRLNKPQSRKGAMKEAAMKKSKFQTVVKPEQETIEVQIMPQPQPDLLSPDDRERRIVPESCGNAEEKVTTAAQSEDDGIEIMRKVKAEIVRLQKFFCAPKITYQQFAAKINESKAKLIAEGIPDGANEIDKVFCLEELAGMMEFEVDKVVEKSSAGVAHFEGTSMMNVERRTREPTSYSLPFSQSFYISALPTQDDAGDGELQIVEKSPSPEEKSEDAELSLEELIKKTFNRKNDSPERPPTMTSYNYYKRAVSRENPP